MHSEERAVAMAHFIQPATVAAISSGRRWIEAFAAEHGMPAARRADVSLALSEALTNAVRHAYGPHEHGEVVLDAATDGEWLSVRVADAGRGTRSTSLGVGLPLMRDLADRLEIGPVLHGPGTAVLMEFPMGAPVEITAAPRAAGRPRERGRPAPRLRLG